MIVSSSVTVMGIVSISSITVACFLHRPQKLYEGDQVVKFTMIAFYVTVIAIVSSSITS